MTVQPAIRPVPLPGLSRFGIDRRGRVFKIDFQRSSRHKIVPSMSLEAIEGQWFRHAEPNGGLTMNKEGNAFTFASFHPETNSASVIRQVEVTKDKFESNFMPTMTEQRVFPLPDRCDLALGWYKLPGISWVPVATNLGCAMQELPGIWYFHGHSVANQVFNQSAR